LSFAQTITRTQYQPRLTLVRLAPYSSYFDLPYPLAGHVELLPDLLERVLPFAPNAEQHPDHLLLFGRKRLQNPRS
jgi:hypothetical protein